MVIYIDIYFFITFMADYLSLIIAARILKRRFPLLRAVLSLLAASLGATVGIAIALPYVIQLALSLVMLISSAIITFKVYTVRDLLLNASLVFCVGIFIGGFLELMIHIVSMLGYSSKVVSVIICFLLSLLSVLALHKILSVSFTPNTCEIKAKLKQNFCVFTAMIDTGSFLNEPLSKRPIILVSKSVYLCLTQSVDEIVKLPMRCGGVGGICEMYVFRCDEIAIKYDNFTFLSDSFLGYSEDIENRFADCEGVIPSAAIMLSK